MRRVVVLGRGGAGKSVFARRLGARTGLPVVELDREFWQGGLRPLSRTGWSAVQARLAAGEEWILDGDLGPTTCSTCGCAGRTRSCCSTTRCRAAPGGPLRRGRERADFWRWVVAYRWRSRPAVLATVARVAPGAALHVLRGPRAAERFLSG